LGAQLFCITLWKLWDYRNDCVFNLKTPNPIELVTKVNFYIQDLNSTNASSHIYAPPQMLSENHVVRIENYTIFVDAGCFSNGSTGWGLVAYDQPNSIYISACRKENIEIDPLLAEVLGIRWGLQTAKDLNWQTVTIMSDAEVVVKCINSKVYVAAIDHIVQDCRELLLAFQSTNVMFIKRDLNVVAHSLVNLSKLAGCRTWSGCVPTQANFASAVSSIVI
jgi:ribonuclease HI